MLGISDCRGPLIQTSTRFQPDRSDFHTFPARSSTRFSDPLAERVGPLAACYNIPDVDRYQNIAKEDE